MAEEEKILAAVYTPNRYCMLLGCLCWKTEKEYDNVGERLPSKKIPNEPGKLQMIPSIRKPATS